MTSTTAASLDLAPFLCPRCGGEADVREGARLGRCRFCRAPLLAVTPDHRLRFAVPSAIDARAAGDAVRRLLAPPEVSRAEARRARLQDVRLFYVPYWRFQATAVGRLSGVRRVERRVPRAALGDEGPAFPPETVLRRLEQVDRPVREMWRATLSASPVDDLGIPTLSPLRQRSAGMRVTEELRALGELRFFDDRLFRDATVLDVMVPEEEARRQAEALFERWAETRGFDLEGRVLQVMRLQDRCYLVYYPVYHVVYRHRGRAYRASVDGTDGRVVWAEVPSEPRLAVLSALAGTGVVAFMAGAPLRVVLSPPAGLPELAGLRAHPGFWAGVAVGVATVVAAGRHILARWRTNTERVIGG